MHQAGGEHGGGHAATPPEDLAPTLGPLVGRGGPRPALDALRTLGHRRVQLDARLPGLRPRDLDGTGRRDLLAVLRRLELLPAGLDFLIPHEHLVDPTRADRAVAATIEAAGLAADLGGLVLCVHLPRPPAAAGDAAGGPPHHDAEGAVATVLDASERAGVRVADHGAGATRRTAGAVGVDPAACLARDEVPVDRVLAAGDRLAAVRLCDLLPTGVRGPAGLAGGRLDLAAYRAALSAAGWNGPVACDLRQLEDPWAGLARSAVAWRAALPAALR